MNMITIILRRPAAGIVMGLSVEEETSMMDAWD